MIHLIFIVLHSVAGISAFIFGWICMYRLESKSFKELLWVFLISLLGLDTFMIAAIIVDIPILSQGQLYTFIGLTLLGLYMLYRGYRAYVVQKESNNRWRLSFINHVGFILISLFDGFVIVSAIDLNIPVWGIIIIGISGVIVGISGINHVKAKLS